MRISKISIYFITVCLLIFPSGSGISINAETEQEEVNVLPLQSVLPPFVQYKYSNWVENLMTGMTLEEKIGQLFMVAAYSNRDERHFNDLKNLVEKHHIGGLIFFQGTPAKQVDITNKLQNAAKYPLLIAMDAEWGLSMRLNNTMSFPRQMTLGAINDDSLVYAMGRDIGRQLKSIGVHINFAPVVDVNNNPDNPVIHTRSFGEDKWNVAHKGIAYMKGLQDEKVLAVAKHFPGHGDTDVDSHYDLPVINHDKERLSSIELVPFRSLINAGTGGIMTAHISLPELDNRPSRGASLSYNVTTLLLKNEMNFSGITFTDALNMKGVSKFFNPGDVDVEAFIAGNDILLFSENVPLAIKKIIQAIESGKISESDIDNSVRKILSVKKWTGLDNKSNTQIKFDANDLKNPKSLVLNRKLIENAITLVENKNKLIPLKNLANTKIATLSIGSQEKTHFQNRLSSYTQIDHFNIPSKPLHSQSRNLINQLKNYDIVITSLHSISRFNLTHFGISSEAVKLILNLDTMTNQILVVFGTPYSLKLFPDLDQLICAYENGRDYQDLAAQLIFGGISAKGKLPVNVGNHYHLNQGTTTYNSRLRYSLPEEAGINSAKLHKNISDIMLEAINDQATPGAQILVAKNGHVIYQESFGNHTYDNNHRVENTDIYDLASITKIAATTLAVMRFYELGLIDPDKTVSDYIPEAKNTNKADLKIIDILAHRSGLQAWIPFYRHSLTKEGLCMDNYCIEPGGIYASRVADNIYIADDYKDVLWETIYSSQLRNNFDGHLYSDIGMFFLKRIVESLANNTMDKFLYENFYRPLGMTSTVFNPRNHFSLDKIIPTEVDNYFRMQTIHGDVHDPASAMLGGVAGHAGLFSNTNDLAILMQMLLNGGTYGDEFYLTPETIEYFTTRHFDSRKGLGFDMPEPNKRKISPVTDKASINTFGHLGFTGTAVWADPDNELIYVFLSNRTFPTQDNRKLVQQSIRTKVQSAIYNSFIHNDTKTSSN